MLCAGRGMLCAGRGMLCAGRGMLCARRGMLCAGRGMLCADDSPILSARSEKSTIGSKKFSLQTPIPALTGVKGTSEARKGGETHVEEQVKAVQAVHDLRSPQGVGGARELAPRTEARCERVHSRVDG